MLLRRVVGRTLYAEQHPTDQHGQVAQQALRAVHTRGLLHGDVKDDNIMLTNTADGSDDVRLIDFGCSSDRAPCELHLAEERELTRIFAAKVSCCCWTAPHCCCTRLVHHATIYMLLPRSGDRPELRALHCDFLCTGGDLAAPGATTREPRPPPPPPPLESARARNIPRSAIGPPPRCG
jgi:serine/threonine protein kinase